MPSLRILPAMTAAALTLSAAVASCSDDRQSYVRNIGDGETTPTIKTEDVRTFISDSGYTRIFVETPLWYMFDEATPPYWLFPEGVALDEYDRDMNVISKVRCDTAKYLTQEKRWRLRGNVVMVNTDHDSILTQLMYWDQNKHSFYSDSFVHIVRADRILEGYGFQSNENITEYTINKPTGIFPNRMNRDNRQEKPAEADTIVPASHEQSRADRMHRRPARYPSLPETTAPENTRPRLNSLELKKN